MQIAIYMQGRKEGALKGSQTFKTWRGENFEKVTQKSRNGHPNIQKQSTYQCNCYRDQHFPLAIEIIPSCYYYYQFMDRKGT